MIGNGTNRSYVVSCCDGWKMHAGAKIVNSVAALILIVLPEIEIHAEP